MGQYSPQSHRDTEESNANQSLDRECIHDLGPHEILIFSVPLCLCGENGLLLRNPPGRPHPQHRGSEEQRVNPIQHSAVAGENSARVFHPGAALDQRLDQISQLGRDVQHGRQS